MAAVQTLDASRFGYLKKADIARLADAYRFSESAHAGQKRQSGDPYISHPLAVAEILAGWHLDGQALMAALLHDVMEDTSVTKAEISDTFGKPVAELVDGLSKLDKIEFQTAEDAQAENFRKMLLAMARDVRVILIKLADRLHNMRTTDAVLPAKRGRIARETIEIYAPIAHRLGLNQTYRELQELSFQYMRPWRHGALSKALARARGHLEPDVAGADEQRAAARCERRQDGVDVANRAQVVHAGEVHARHGERSSAAARREQQAVVREHASVAQPDAAHGRLDFLGARAELERDAFLRVERRRSQQQAFARKLAGKILFRQRRPLIRRIGLVAEQCDRASKALLAQRLNGLRGRLAAADDHEMLAHRVLYSKNRAAILAAPQGLGCHDPSHPFRIVRRTGSPRVPRSRGRAPGRGRSPRRASRDRRELHRRLSSHGALSAPVTERPRR